MSEQQTQHGVPKVGKKTTSRQQAAKLLNDVDRLWSQLMASSDDLQDLFVRLRDSLAEDEDIDAFIDVRRKKLARVLGRGQNATNEQIIQSLLVLMFYVLGYDITIDLFSTSPEAAVEGSAATIMEFSAVNDWSKYDLGVSMVSTVLMTLSSEFNPSRPFKTLWAFLGETSADEDFCKAVEATVHKRLDETHNPTFH